MARITDLPNELLTTIFRYTRECNPVALPALPLLCRSLHQAGNAVLHERITLYWKLNSHSSLIKFIQQDPNTDLVRSLRLQVPKAPLNAFTLGMKVAHLHVNAICNMLATLSKLATFSICLAGQVDQRCTLPGSVLGKILDALPESVKDLELDTEGVDGTWGDGPKMNFIVADSHMCPSLSRLLPQLENLRLRIGTLCPQLLLSLQGSVPGVQPTTKLKLATINLELGDARHPGPGITCNCDRPTTRSAYEHNNINPTTFFALLLELQKAGAFPKLRHFYILTNKEHPMVRVRDVATRSVTDYPLQFADSVSSSPTIQDEDASIDGGSATENGSQRAEQQVNPFDIKQWYIIRDQDGSDWYGSLKQIRAAIDFEGRWKEAKDDGWRLPRKFRATQRVRTHRLRTKGLKSLEWMLDEADSVARNSDMMAHAETWVNGKASVREVSVPVDRIDSGARASVQFVE